MDIVGKIDWEFLGAFPTNFWASVELLQAVLGVFDEASESLRNPQKNPAKNLSSVPSQQAGKEHPKEPLTESSKESGF